MSEHNIDNFMKLALNGKGTINRESGSDYYYREVYRFQVDTLHYNSRYLPLNA